MADGSMHNVGKVLVETSHTRVDDVEQTVAHEWTHMLKASVKVRLRVVMWRVAGQGAREYP